MPDKYKQYRSRQHWEKNDDAIQIEVINHIIKISGLTRRSIKREWYLGYMGEPRHVKPYEYITRKQVEAGITLRNPDIMILDKYCRVACVVEIDGAIHDIKTAKTAKRNIQYEAMDIPYFVLNLADLKHTNTTWRECLDKNERFKVLLERIQA